MLVCSCWPELCAKPDDLVTPWNPRRKARCVVCVCSPRDLAAKMKDKRIIGLEYTRRWEQERPFLRSKVERVLTPEICPLAATCMLCCAHTLTYTHHIHIQQ